MKRGSFLGDSSFAFSILELLIVIAIVSIIFFLIAVSYYDKFKSKAYLEEDALGAARACFQDLIVFCMENPNASIRKSFFPNCHDREALYGRIIFEVPEENCNGDILPEGYTIKVYSTSSNFYYVECHYRNYGYQCSIKPQS